MSLQIIIIMYVKRKNVILLQRQLYFVIKCRKLNLGSVSEVNNAQKYYLEETSTFLWICS